jgi:hypothetical protein
MLLAALRASKDSDEEQDAQTREANDHLEKNVLNWLAMMRKRPLLHAYEYLIPPSGKACGWYWRHQKADPRDWINWHGPFPSRKAAVEARLRVVHKSGGAKTPLEALEKDIFDAA